MVTNERQGASTPDLMTVSAVRSTVSVTILKIDCTAVKTKKANGLLVRVDLTLLSP